uniref:Uncharacterized protein n=1 Tax=Rhizophora mucronata TaxID=61149 RepID=A0A2P2NC27_RHIMU
MQANNYIGKKLVVSRETKRDQRERN